MWKIQQAMLDDAIRTARIHPAFIPVTGLKCSYGKISSPLTEISGTVPVRPLIWTHRTFYKGFRGKGEISKTGLMWRGPNIGKTTTLHVHRTFLYISLPSLHDYDVKFPNFTFCGGREHKTTSFFFTWTSMQSCRHLTNWTIWNKRDKVSGSMNLLFNWRFRCPVAVLVA